MRWVGHVARIVSAKGVYRVLVGKSEGRRSRRRRGDIKTDLQEVGIWPGLAWPRIKTGSGRL